MELLIIVALMYILLHHLKQLLQSLFCIRLLCGSWRPLPIAVVSQSTAHFPRRLSWSYSHQPPHNRSYKCTTCTTNVDDRSGQLSTIQYNILSTNFIYIVDVRGCFGHYTVLTEITQWQDIHNIIPMIIYLINSLCLLLQCL